MSSESQQLWFYIGSVDTFERNLNDAQLELQIDSANFIPVLYKSQIELSNIVSALPTLLILGFVAWSFMRAGNMMSGMSKGSSGKGKSYILYLTLFCKVFN